MRPLPAITVTAAVTLALAAAAGCASSTAGTGRGVPVPSPTRIGPETPTAPVTSSAPAPTTPTTRTTPSETAGTVTLTAPASDTAHPVPSSPLRTIPVVGSDGTAYVVKVWAQAATPDCAAVSYGTVSDFLRRHPCSSVDRLLATTRVGGRDVGFAQSTVAFSGPNETAMYRTAGKFRTLVTQNGTGNVDDLLRAGYRLPSGPTSLPQPDAFLAQAQDNTVTIVDAWYLSGATPENDPPLIKMARDIYLQVG